MKRKALLLTLFYMLLWGAASAQKTAQIAKLKPPKDFENIHVQRLTGDAFATQFVIWVRQEVPKHFHALHSETVMVLRGSGEMTLGDSVFTVQKGDLVFIPVGTPHAVRSTGGILQVLSVQAPEFDGKDRIMVAD